MKKRIIALLLALLMLTSAGCGSAPAAKEPADEEPALGAYQAGAPEQEAGQSAAEPSLYLRLYGLADLSEKNKSNGGGDAVTGISIPWAEITAHDRGRQQQAQYIMELLLGGCTKSDFICPVPTGTRLLSCTVTGGTVSVDLSGEYNQLMGIDRTIADYCITLSLLQLTGIYAVRITVMDVSPANHEEVYTSAQVLLTSPEDIVRTVEVTLYFPDELGNLTAEERRLTVYEGETPAEAVVKALTERPMDIYAGLERLLPKGFTALAASVEDGTCYLNLPGSVVSLLPEDSQKQRIMLEGLVNSLCSLEGVEQVQILLNGDYQMLLGTQPVSRPLLPTE